MNIIVTGGAGYIGYSVVKGLAKKYPNAGIIIYDNFSKGRLEGIGSVTKEFKNIEIIPWEKADIRDYHNFREVIKKYSPEIVIHLAAIVDAFTTNREGKDRECEIVNYEATVEIAKICKEEDVKKFIYQSSVSIYSRGEDLKEDALKEPLSIYGKNKLKAEEEILKLNNENFKVCALRSATLVGYNPCFRYETIINLICVRALYNVLINIFESALDNDKSYLYLEDEVEAIIFAIENIDKMSGKSFNIASFNTNLRTVLNLIKSEIGETNYIVTPQKTINQQVYTINSDKIKRLGFKCHGTIEGVIKETIRELRKNNFN